MKGGVQLVSLIVVVAALEKQEDGLLWDATMGRTGDRKEIMISYAFFCRNRPLLFLSFFYLALRSVFSGEEEEEEERSDETAVVPFASATHFLITL